MDAADAPDFIRAGPAAYGYDADGGAWRVVCIGTGRHTGSTKCIEMPLRLASGPRPPAGAQPSWLVHHHPRRRHRHGGEVFKDTHTQLTHTQFAQTQLSHIAYILRERWGWWYGVLWIWLPQSLAMGFSVSVDIWPGWPMAPWMQWCPWCSSWCWHLWRWCYLGWPWLALAKATAKAMWRPWTWSEMMLRRIPQRSSPPQLHPLPLPRTAKFNKRTG